MILKSFKISSLEVFQRYETTQKLLDEDAEPAERKIRFSSLASRETYGLIRMQTGTQNTPPLIPPLPTALLVVSDC